jgi:hypothetical protein
MGEIGQRVLGIRRRIIVIACAQLLLAWLLIAGSLAPATAVAGTPYVLHGTVRSAFHNLPLADTDVEIWREVSPGAWGLEGVALSDSFGSWTYSTDADTAARIRVVDNTTICGDAWLGGETVDTASDVAPTPSPGTQADITLGVVNEGVVAGTAYDAYLQAPVSGIKVSLCPAGGDLTDALDSTTTDTNGSYRFSGVGPSSYTLYFEDAAGRFFPQWYDYQPDAGTADWVNVDAPGAYQADVYLDGDGIQYQTEFSATTIASSDGLFWAGRPVTLQANLYDAISRQPLDSLAVTVQSSLDRRVWTTIGSASQHPADRGSYVFTYVPSDYTARYFRFRLETSDAFVGSTSAEAQWHPALQSGVWETVTCNGAPSSSVRVDTKTFVIASTLRDKGGHLERDGYVYVEQSLDGVKWLGAPATVSQSASGRYEAVVQAGQARMYRFISRPPPYYGRPTVTSTIITILSPREVRFFGPSDKRPRRGRKFSFVGRFRPPSSTGARSVRIVLQRRVRGKWKPYATYRPRVGNYVGAAESIVMADTKLKSRGTYRVRMSVPAVPGFLPGSSEWMQFKVR